MRRDEDVGVFAARLRNLLRAYGISNVELARRLSASPQNVQRWVWGKVEPTYVSLKRMQAAIGCDWCELMGEPYERKVECDEDVR